MFQDQASVVIDNGSNFSKAGFSVEVNPRCCFPTIVGKDIPTVLMSRRDTQVYVGEEALAKAQDESLTLNYPIQYGIVQNFDDMEKIWHHTFFNQLGIDSKDYPTFITEAPMNPRVNRENTVQIMFETFNVPQFYMATQPALAFCASGRSTGIIVDSGADVTHVISINELYFDSHEVQKSNLAGSACTHYLSSILEGFYLKFTSFEMEIIRQMKEQFCYVALDYNEEMEKYKQTTAFDVPYLLPDDNIVAIKNQRFRCPEILFNQNYIQTDLQAPGLHKLVHQSITRYWQDTYLQRNYYNNILLSGGSTMFPGFAERLGKELKNLSPQGTQIKVIAPNERNYYAWKGGSCLASLPRDKWITKEEYNDWGPQIIHKRCRNF